MEHGCQPSGTLEVSFLPGPVARCLLRLQRDRSAHAGPDLFHTHAPGLLLRRGLAGGQELREEVAVSTLTRFQDSRDWGHGPSRRGWR